MNELAARYASLAGSHERIAAEYRMLANDEWLLDQRSRNLEAAARHEAQAAEYDRLAADKVAA
jgi:hypothetical protein